MAADFLKLETAYFSLYQFSIGLILLWITINFGIIKSILFHFVYNGLAIAALLSFIQIPDAMPHRFENDTIIVDWQRVSVFDITGTSVKLENDKLIADHIDVSGICSLAGAKPATTKRLQQLAPFMRFNFRFEVKKPQEKIILNEEINKFLSDQMIKSLEQR